jgi:hypothetical protein
METTTTDRIDGPENPGVSTIAPAQEVDFVRSNLELRAVRS